METLLLIDGNCLVARSAFALPDSITDSQGQPINAVVGFTSTLLRLLTTHLPKMLAVAFDPSGPSFRHQILTTYKSGRVKLPASFPRQLESVKQVLDVLTIPHCTHSPFEADDLLATWVSHASGKDNIVLIATTDRDMFQLVNDPWIKLLMPRRAGNGYTVYDESATIARVGVPPRQYLEYSALRGDLSDNIPGVQGIGPKTAAKLLSQFGTLDRLFENLDALPSKVGYSLRQNRELVDRNLRLMRLVSDIPVGEMSAPFEPSKWDLKLIASTFERLCIGQLVERFAHLAAKYSQAISAHQAGTLAGTKHTTTHQRICLVSCGAQKASSKLPAKNLYTSDLFRNSRAYAEAFYAKWFIVSAKHALLQPDTLTSPYDLSLNDLSETEKRQWATKIIASLSRKSSFADAISLLAGEDYALPLLRDLRKRGNRVHFPFEGMTSKERLQWLNSELASRQMRSDLEQFYSLLRELRDGAGGPRWLGQCNGRMQWPQRGVYFFLEPEETRFDKSELRVTRVGTHAVSRSARSSLWGRLRSHRGLGPDGGAHRSSVFRLHVGAAIIAQSGRYNEFADWGRGGIASSDILAKEKSLESEVSAYIGTLEVLTLNVGDAASPLSDRAYIEQNAISLLSRAGNAVDPPSSSWLGLFSPSLPIRRNGLWNLNYVNGAYDPQFLNVLRFYVDVTLGRREYDGKSVAPPSWRGTDFTSHQLSLFDAEDCNE